MKRLLLILSLVIPASAQFTDTSGNVSTAASMMWLRGITTGCSSNTFGPTTPVSRQEIATFIVRAVYSAETGDPENFAYTASPAYFTDVPSNSVYYKYVQKFRDLGLTSGCSPNTFCPTGSVTNGELAVFVARARQIIAGQPTVGAPDCSPFGDHTVCSARQSFPYDFGSYASWGHDYVEFMFAATGFVGLSECNEYLSYCSNTAATRGQVALDVVSVWDPAIPIQYPVTDKLQVTGPTASLIPWYVDGGLLGFGGGTTYPGQIQVKFSSPFSPSPAGTSLSAGCNGKGSTDIANGVSANLNYFMLYNTGSCQQVFFRINTIGGYKYDFKYFTPYAVGSAVLTTDPIDVTPGEIIEPPNAVHGPTLTTTDQHVIVTTASGGRIRYNRGDKFKGEVPYRFTKTEDGWRYQYDVSDLHDAVQVRLGDPEQDLTDPAPYSERIAPSAHNAKSAQPQGFSPFLSTGWMSLHPGEASSGAGTFSMTSGRKPGLMPVFIQGDVLQLRELRHMTESENVLAPLSDEAESSPEARQREHDAIMEAVHWSSNSTRRFVIGPAINADAGRGEVLVQVKRWVEEYGFEFLRPLTTVEGDGALEALSRVKPATQLEKDITSCLADALK